jgi:4'-phosphopantetheinyl transferase
MIYYLVQTIADLPWQPEDGAPAGMFSAEETERCQSFRIEKRRREWLLGRWTAKLLVQDFLLQKTGEQIPFEAIEILTAPDGAPLLRLGGQAGEGSDPFSGLTLSISHSYEAAFCALLERPGWRLGADIERVEPRPAGFAQDYFTEIECERLQALQPALCDPYVTAIWSAKEAVLKALRLGLTVDTSWVRCWVDPANWRADGWQPYSMELHPQLLDDASGNGKLFLMGWWKTWGEYILTLATCRPLLPVLEPVPFIQAAEPAYLPFPS